ncbi:MAG: hypothetical protein K8R88_04230 [Armatimonadetes bacterium]|nr:hypothetical protein [Armatimonadota bacterium]
MKTFIRGFVFASSLLPGMAFCQADEINSLRDQSQKVIQRMADLAASGKMTVNDESVRLLQEMADELKAINEKLKALQTQLDTKSKDVDKLKKFQPFGWEQFQYRSSDQLAAKQDSFNFRRIRIGANYVIDPKTTMRFSFDAAAGAASSTPTLRDAQLIYTPNPKLTLRAGQFPVRLGYEMARSSSDREQMERSQYIQKNFAAERSQGIMADYELTPALTGTLAAVNSLTINDPEQAGVASSTAGRRVGAMAGLRMKVGKGNVGVSGLASRRPLYTTSVSVAGAPVVAPDIKREYLFLDAFLPSFIVPQLSFRGEFMTGRDRNNLGNYTLNAGAARDYSAVSVRGWHGQLSYALSPKSDLSVRLEEFDPNTATTGNSVKVYGGVYQYFLNPTAKIALSYELFRTSVQNYRVFTVRSQFKF